MLRLVNDLWEHIFAVVWHVLRGLIGLDQHVAFLIGQDRNADQASQNTQKFNCYKIAEFGVGLSMNPNNFGSVVIQENKGEVGKPKYW